MTFQKLQNIKAGLQKFGREIKPFITKTEQEGKIVGNVMVVSSETRFKGVGGTTDETTVLHLSHSQTSTRCSPMISEDELISSKNKYDKSIRSLGFGYRRREESAETAADQL